MEDLRVTLGGRDSEKETRWFLEHASNLDKEWMIAIEGVPFVIGRDKDSHLRLSAKWVSRFHAEIRSSGDLLWIRDLGSTNGTFLNHKQIKQAELLEAGDIITIGRSDFTVRRVEAEAIARVEETCTMDLSEDMTYLASIEPKLRALLSGRSVIPHFQPILSLSDVRLAGYEILGRIAEKDLPSSPAELLDAAESLGYASDLSALFREVGIEVARSLPGAPILFANTCSVETSHIDGLLESMEKIHRMDTTNKVVLEINEKAVTDTSEMLRLRRVLGSLDIGLAFDDFGVGQTRLVDLAKVPPDFLKFDMSLIRQIHLAPKRLHQMVSTFVKAAKDLGIATLAEGIECLEEGETCRQLGFDFAQGYYYGKPLPITEIKVPLRE